MSNNFGNQFKFIAGVVIILRKDDKILFLRRKDTGFMDGYYGCPGGKVEGGETIIQAGVREALEKVSVNISPDKMQVVHVAKFLHPGRREGFCFFVEAFEWEGEPYIMEPKKYGDMVWASLNDLSDKIIPVEPQILRDISKKLFYSDHVFEEIR